MAAAPARRREPRFLWEALLLAALGVVVVPGTSACGPEPALRQALDRAVRRLTHRAGDARNTCPRPDAARACHPPGMPRSAASSPTTERTTAP